MLRNADCLCVCSAQLLISRPTEQRDKNCLPRSLKPAFVRAILKFSTVIIKSTACFTLSDCLAFPQKSRTAENSQSQRPTCQRTAITRPLKRRPLGMPTTASTPPTPKLPSPYRYNPLTAMLTRTAVRKLLFLCRISTRISRNKANCNLPRGYLRSSTN